MWTSEVPTDEIRVPSHPDNFFAFSGHGPVSASRPVNSRVTSREAMVFVCRLDFGEVKAGTSQA